MNPRARIELARQIGSKAAPLVLACAGNREPARPTRSARRRQGGRLPGDVAVDIAANQVLRRRLPVHRGIEELTAVRAPGPAEGRQIRRGAGLVQRRSQRVRAVARRVLVEDRAVPAELQLDDARRAPLTAISSRTIRSGSHAPFHLHLVRDWRDSPPRRTRRADRCRRSSGPSARRSLCPMRDAEERRLARADDVPARRVQVDDVAQRRIVDFAVRIVGDDRLAGRRHPAAHDPVVAAGLGALAGVMAGLSRWPLAGQERRETASRRYGSTISGSGNRRRPRARLHHIVAYRCSHRGRRERELVPRIGRAPPVRLLRAERRDAARELQLAGGIAEAAAAGAASPSPMVAA